MRHCFGVQGEELCRKCGHVRLIIPQSMSVLEGSLVLHPAIDNLLMPLVVVDYFRVGQRMNCIISRRYSKLQDPCKFPFFDKNMSFIQGRNAGGKIVWNDQWIDR